MAGNGYTRTSRSQLPDRYVRVDRRLRVDDGAFGTYQNWTTIIQNYPVRLWPDASQRVERKELGEQIADSVQMSFRALGDPARNGRTIRVGDRFVDLVNNRCYDVVAVPRPRGRSPYSAMHQFELRRVDDDCHDVSVPYDNADAAPLPDQTHFIMRHLGNNEIFGWESLPYFDGVVYNLQYDDPLQLAEIAAIVAAGRRWWRYYTLLDYPHAASIFGGGPGDPPLASWFNYLRSNVQFTGGGTSHRRMRVADTVSLFAGSGGSGQFRELIPWPSITSGERASLEAQMVALALAPGGVLAPASGIFLDQANLQLFTSLVESNPASQSGHGNVEEGSPKLTALNFAGTVAAFGNGGTWLDYSTALSALYIEIGALLSPSGRYAIKNGQHSSVNGMSVPNPRMFENAWDNATDGSTQPERWANAKAGFATDPRNILSIVCSSSPNASIGVPEALEFWLETGGWLSFTDDGSAQGVLNREAAYASAAALLASLGFPR